MIRNWKYYEKPCIDKDLFINKGQYMAGNIMGVLMAPTLMQCERGHVGNAKSFDYPVRYEVIEHLYGNEEAAKKEIKEKIKKLETEGCRFIITSGQEFGLFHNVISEETDLLTLSTTLLAVPLAASSIKLNSIICIVNHLNVETNLQILHKIGIEPAVIDKCVFSDENLQQAMDSRKKEIDIHSVTPEAYIWDCAEPCSIEKKAGGRQVYTIVKIADMLKESVTQTAYAGFL